MQIKGLRALVIGSPFPNGAFTYPGQPEGTGKKRREEATNEVEEICLREISIQIYHLRCIHHTSTPNSQVGVAFGLLPELNGLFHRVILRLNHHIGKNLILDPSAFKRGDCRQHNMGASRSIVLSVITMTFFALRFAKSIPTSRVLPGPNRILGAAISKAYSFWRPTGVASDRAPSTSEAAETAEG